METASAAPGGLARGLLWMGWRHGAGARESAPKTEREGEREERKEKQGRVKAGWGCGCCCSCCRWFARLCTDVLLRQCITCLSGISQRRRAKCTQLWERKDEGEKMEKSYCTRCGRRLQEFQIILEMNKKNQARQTAEWEAVRELNHAQNNGTDGVSPVFVKSRKTFLWYIFL